MLTEREKQILETPEQKAYEEYAAKIGGDPIGLEVPNGYPPGVEERGGPVAVYRECIKKGVTWEELLGITDPPADVVI